MIDVSGVRSSWLTVARKLDLSRSMSFSWTFISSRRLFWASSSRLFSSVASMCTWLVRKVFCPAATSVSRSCAKWSSTFTMVDSGARRIFAR